MKSNLIRGMLRAGAFLFLVGNAVRASEVLVTPAGDELVAGGLITLSFAQPMVSADAIDRADVPAPVEFDPPLAHTFLWKSQTDGELTVAGPLRPGTHYRLLLKPGLKNLAGHDVPQDAPLAEYDTQPFRLETWEEERNRLPVRPLFFFHTNYAVKFADAVQHIFFQNRATLERVPVEVTFYTDDAGAAPVAGFEFGVRPRQDLAVGRRYDVVTDGLVEAGTGTPLQYPQAFPAGATRPLQIDWVGAFHHAGSVPCIRIKADAPLDAESVSADTVLIEPRPPNLRMRVPDAMPDEIVAEGGFDPAQRYVVRVTTAVRGVHGFALAAESRWGATFHPKPPAILMPGREVFLRSRRGLKFALVQVNTGPATWRLARVPLEKLAALQRRMREYEEPALDYFTGQPVKDAATGFTRKKTTDPLVEAFRLEVVGEGRFEASSGDVDTVREIDWAPPTGLLAGAFLLEVIAPTPDGRKTGNRTLIFFSDWMVTEKNTASRRLVRVARMADGQPLAGVTVRMLSEEHDELARAVTDKDGFAALPRESSFEVGGRKCSAHVLVADTPDGPALQWVGSPQFDAGNPWQSRPGPLRLTVVTDRNLYRPGETIKMFGLARIASGTALTIPAGQHVTWRIVSSNSGNTVGEGSAVVSSRGSWTADWTVPDALATGAYSLVCEAVGESRDAATFRIEEYRPLPFSVDVRPQPANDEVARVRVASVFFHGAPNAGARVHWKAVWNLANPVDWERDVTFLDSVPMDTAEQKEWPAVEGDGVLDGNGTALLESRPPFPAGQAFGRCTVQWTVEVLSADGHTVAGGADQTIQPAPILGIRARHEPAAGVVCIAVEARDRDHRPIDRLATRIELFHVATKTVKEQVGPFVFRYRNTHLFEKVGAQEVVAPAEIRLPVKASGRYAAVATAPGQPAVPLVSVSVLASGEDQSELPVEDDVRLKVTHAERPLAPGEKLVLDVESPFGGLAWVTIETDEVLDSLVVPMPGNAGRIELPVKSSYAPNAVAAVHLLKAGGERNLPLERFGWTRFEVKRDDRMLVVLPRVERDAVEPRERVRGTVSVQCAGKPAADAEVAVFAVDERVLRLGDWKMPDVGALFYPRNPFSVVTRRALHQLVAAITTHSGFQKGFVVGDGGEAAPSVGTDELLARKQFRTLAFWQTDLVTDADGRATFEFEAPDNLTTFRVSAVAHTMPSAVGSGETRVQVTKPLICDAALPRFVRAGDELELRAIARRRFDGPAELQARCVVDDAIELLAPDQQTRSAPRDVPVVFGFRARARPDATRATIRFELRSASGKADVVEHTLPVHPPTVVRRESVAGLFAEAPPSARIPDRWLRATTGTVDLTVSTSPWLPKLVGLPQVLDYPHGCFEQIGSRVLAYALLGDLLAFLPDAAAREPHYRKALEAGLHAMEQSLRPDGFLPYWPGNRDASPFVTVLAHWAAREAATAGFTVPGALIKKTGDAVRRIVAGRAPAEPFVRAFALMATADTPDNEDAAVAQDLYLRRDSFSDETRALLAVACLRRGILRAESDRLLRELGGPPPARAFDPTLFGSTGRDDALRALAFATAGPDRMPADLRARLHALLESGEDLSTQENLWLLLAFDALHRAEKHPSLHGTPPPTVKRSPNGASAMVQGIPLGGAAAGSKLLPLTQFLNSAGAPAFGDAAAWLLRAEYRTADADPGRDDRGLRIERVVRNLTDAARTGEAGAPFRLGDRILVTYRLHSRKLHHHVALEDALPAGLETINPDLPAIGRFHDLPREQEGALLALAHAELRDDVTRLYFDRVEPGLTLYAVLARATCPGTFRWPPTQAVPMYDTRFGGLSPATACVIVP